MFAILPVHFNLYIRTKLKENKYGDFALFFIFSLNSVKISVKAIACAYKSE